MIKFNYIGSKYRILDFIIPEIWPAKTLVDPFCGTCSVSYEAKKLGLRVVSGDYMLYPYNMALSIIQNNTITLDESDIKFLLSFKPSGIAAEIYGDIYLSREVWDLIDGIRGGINKMKEEKRPLALAALSAAIITGHASMGGFTVKSMPLDRIIRDKNKFIELFNKKVVSINSCVIPGDGRAFYCDAIETIKNNSADVLYLDPPYVTKYVRNYKYIYHVLENLISNFKLELRKDTKHPIPINFTNETTKRNIKNFIRKILLSAQNYKRVLLSYNSNGVPCVDEMKKIFADCGFTVFVKQTGIKYHITSNVESKRGTELLYIATRA